jgi:hypothetical protein
MLSGAEGEVLNLEADKDPEVQGLDSTSDASVASRHAPAETFLLRLRLW